MASQESWCTFVSRDEAICIWEPGIGTAPAMEERLACWLYLVQHSPHFLQQQKKGGPGKCQSTVYSSGAPDCGSEGSLHIVLYIPHCTRPGTNINDTSVIRKRNLNGQIRQTAVQADCAGLCTRDDATRDMRKHRRRWHLQMEMVKWGDKWRAIPQQREGYNQKN